ncbi:hypothetical protein [Fulvivirga sediminis]|uniref:Lipocalin-like domain-containing protein n=1 Tax=Fulvivirga sediminis TaxID=2803949 RepID=A0A937K2G6_9BACT|nr:hypothetical protein [Fulvivirga sediminis]MBL3658571.1 hypothetical protein [Fulvivirga sediminis]
MNQFFRISAIVMASFLAFTACSDDDEVTPEEQLTPYEETLQLITNNSSKDWRLVKVLENSVDETEECALDNIYTFKSDLTWIEDINETPCWDEDENATYTFDISEDGSQMLEIGDTPYDLENLTETTMEFHYKYFTDDEPDSVSVEVHFETIN